MRCEYLRAPGDLVGTYSIGDVDRTIALFKHLLPQLAPAGLLPAYKREMDIMPMLLDNSARGIPLDRARLARDTKEYEKLLLYVEKDLRMNWPKEVGGPAPEDFDKADQVAFALAYNKSLTLPHTPTGKLSTAKDALLDALPNWRIKGLLLYRSALEQCLSSYMRPWQAHGEALHCNWNQIRDFSDAGARTGRLSSSPNAQNMTNTDKYDELFALMKQCRCDFKGYKLPNLRSYLVAPKGHVLFSRDYSQQELRFLAYYEDGVLAEAYRKDPDLDVHVLVQTLLKSTANITLERKPTKTINFGKVYGMGGPMLSKKLRIPLDQAYTLIDAYDRALPSVKTLQREINFIGRSGQAITTIGGRRYYAPPAVQADDGTIRTFEYKLLNYLIQGSAADQTKEAMRLWHGEIRNTDTRFLMTVHDQLVGCAPKSKVAKASKLLDTCMREAFTLDVPIKTDPTYGFNFGEMTVGVP